MVGAWFRALVGAALVGATATASSAGRTIMILVPAPLSTDSTPFIWLVIMRTSFMPYPRPSE
jgi:hypothetical protein